MSAARHPSSHQNPNRPEGLLLPQSGGPNRQRSRPRVGRQQLMTTADKLTAGWTAFVWIAVQLLMWVPT